MRDANPVGLRAAQTIETKLQKKLLKVCPQLSHLHEVREADGARCSREMPK